MEQRAGSAVVAGDLVRASGRGGVYRPAHGYLYILPAFLLVVFFILYPVAEAVRLGFTDQSLLVRSTNYVGLRTYVELLTSNAFQVAFRQSLIWLVAGTIGAMLVGFLLGLLITARFPGQGALTALILVPWVLPDIVAATAWKWLYDGHFGLISYFLGVISFPEPALLSSINWVLWALIVVVIWRICPLVALLIRAALEGIPPELYEAAAVDGAGKLTSFRYITLPQLAYPLVIGTLLTGLFVFKDFATVWITTQGGPIDASEILPTFIYRLGFMNFSTGLASAASVVNLVFTLLLAVFYLLAFRRVWREVL